MATTPTPTPTSQPPGTIYSQGPGAMVARQRQSQDEPAKEVKPGERDTAIGQIRPATADGGVTAAQQTSIDRAAVNNDILILLDNIKTVETALLRLKDRLANLS